MQPTYFVEHPDGSYSEAEPQPILIPSSILVTTGEVTANSGITIPDQNAEKP